MELISKEELINKINAYIVTTADVQVVKNLINNMPTALPEGTDVAELPSGVYRQKGKWEKHKTKSGENWWKCSQCGHVEMKRYPYCAICGANMGGEEW